MHKFIMENDYPDQLPTTVEFTVPSDASLTDMLEQFELYLKAVGFNFDGNLEILPEHSFDETVRNSIDDATPEEWNQAYKNVKVTYK